MARRRLTRGGRCVGPLTHSSYTTSGGTTHSILHLLAAKQNLADGVLDGTDDFSAIKMPSGRAAMIERVQAMLGIGEVAPIRTLSPEEALVESLRTRHGEHLLRAEIRAGKLLAVIDGDPTLIASERKQFSVKEETGAPPMEIIDRAAWETMQRLATAGLLQFAGGETHVLHQRAHGAREDAVLLSAE